MKLLVLLVLFTSVLCTVKLGEPLLAKLKIGQRQADHSTTVAVEQKAAEGSTTAAETTAVKVETTTGQSTGKESPTIPPSTVKA